MAAIVAIDLLYRRKKMRNLKKHGHSAVADSIDITKVNNRNDLMEVCRMCLRKAKFPIFAPDSKVDKAGYIKMITNIEVTEGDKLPQKLCHKCDVFLHSLTLFKKQALKANSKLRKQIKVLEGNKESSSDSPLPSKQSTPRQECKSIESKEEQDEHNYSDDCVDNSERNEENVMELRLEYPCEKCTLKFATLNDFILHRRTAHELWKLPCPECKNLFSRSYLNTHIASVHRKERPFVCEVCGIGFPYKIVLQTHQLTHNNDFPFKCDKCPYKSRTNSGLNVHMKLHSGVKPFSCEVCGARFISRGLQKRHSYVHDTNYKFKCEKCDRGFHMKCQLRNHFEAIHEGRKDHECNICNKRFGFRKRMMKHRRQVHKLPSLPSGRTPKYLLAEQLEKEKMNSSDAHP